VFLSLLRPRLQSSPLFPYTTLFRSRCSWHSRWPRRGKVAGPAPRAGGSPTGWGRCRTGRKRAERAVQLAVPRVDLAPPHRPHPHSPSLHGRECRVLSDSGTRGALPKGGGWRHRRRSLRGEPEVRPVRAGESVVRSLLWPGAVRVGPPASGLGLGPEQPALSGQGCLSPPLLKTPFS